MTNHQPITQASTVEQRIFTITVLGRTLEHLGMQMYKRRDVAIAELVANSWDAGANNVYIEVPDKDNYGRQGATIVITDDGIGMSDDQVQDKYLVVGRNRRREGEWLIGDRRVMGRKGIGKLAGFGIAAKMTITTWQENHATSLTLDVEKLKGQDGVARGVEIPGTIGPLPPDLRSPTGTQVVLEELKAKTPLDLSMLQEAIGRRFSRTVRGRMRIFLNTEEIGAPHIAFEKRSPENGYTEETLPSGRTVSYFYAFANDVIKAPEQRGFAVYVWGKIAHAPPFFFNIEGTASGQHGTRYLLGEIEADFIDEGHDDESDVISTDRQEIEWESESVQEFYEWGKTLTRRVLREWANRKGLAMERRIMDDPELQKRIKRLEPSLQKQVSKFLKELGQAEPDPSRALDLANALVRSYEYRQFHDVIAQIEAASADPDQLHQLLTHLSEWKVLESRAILEIVKGRLDIIDTFHNTIVDDAPETAPRPEANNMHDLIAQYPWLLDPEWQVLAEEKTISKQLRDWNVKDVPDESERLRYDFLALKGEHQLAIIEIKRAGHSVTLEELQRLERYKELLLRAHKDILMIMICGGQLEISEQVRRVWEQRPDGRILTWSEIWERTRRYYDHYRAVLEGAVSSPDFHNKEEEVARTREIVDTGTTYRGKRKRAQGIGPQDVNYKFDLVIPD